MKYAEAKQINLSFNDGPKEITTLVIDIKRVVSAPCLINLKRKKIHIKELIVKKCLILKRWTKALMVKHSL